MQRGMLSISKTQLTEIIKYLPVVEENQFLLAKLTAGFNANQDPISILINEEELDLVLDSLPAPVENNSQLLRETRQVLQETLNRLRFNSLTSQ